MPAGLLGVGVQLVSLAALAKYMDPRVATALAVEAAVLHNFAWHERFTWSDRSRPDHRRWLRRLLRFHLVNGSISMAGNVVLMHLLAVGMRLPLIPANMISIVACSVANFCAAEWFVFAPVKIKRPPEEQLFI
jgi:putative flippase GtrA